MSLGVGGEQEGAGVHPAQEGRGDHPPGEGMHRSHAERGTPPKPIPSVEILHLPRDQSRLVWGDRCGMT